MTDVQAALGVSQLQRLDAFVARRNEIAARYDEAFGIFRSGGSAFPPT
jgi:dTDP-4-amino-4,6-dideoxygalactose transaminase